MTTPYFTIADCDRHDETRKQAQSEDQLESAMPLAAMHTWPKHVDPRQCATIRALVAGLREALASCGLCGGSGMVERNSGSYVKVSCPRCKSGRELLAAVEGKP